MDSVSSSLIYSTQQQFDKNALLVPDLESCNDWSSTSSPSALPAPSSASAANSTLASATSSAMAYFNFPNSGKYAPAHNAHAQQQMPPSIATQFSFMNYPANFAGFDPAAMLDMSASAATPAAHHNSHMALSNEGMPDMMMFSTKSHGSPAVMQQQQQQQLHHQQHQQHQQQASAYAPFGSGSGSGIVDISHVPGTPDHHSATAGMHTLTHHQYHNNAFLFSGNGSVGSGMAAPGVSSAAPMGTLSAAPPASAAGGLDMSVIAKLTSSSSASRRKASAASAGSAAGSYQDQDQDLDSSSSISESETSGDKPRAKRYPVPEALLQRRGGSESEFKSKLKGTRGRRRRSIMSALPPDELQAELDARLNRNRQSARDCRLRKKYYINTLEKQVDDLRKREDEVTAALGQVREERDRLAEECNHLRAQITAMQHQQHQQHQ